ncbi:MAG: hypothetical protein JRN15_01715 [Nitrososphaerota archaeon]|nr:hypothetical protein [Nitrososphaerota archaeon]
MFKKMIRRFYDRNDAFIRRLRKQGAKVGKEVQIVDRFRFLYEPWYANLLELKDGVVISAGVRFVQHDSSYPNIVGNLPIKFGKIVVGENSYIGVNSVILPGVTIGDHCLIAAGSIVNKNIPSYSIAAGNPARIIGSVNDGVEKYKTRIQNKGNNNIYFWDFGGSYGQMKRKFGKNLADIIAERYAEYCVRHGL